MDNAKEPPLNLYKPKEPYTATIVSVERLVGPKAPVKHAILLLIMVAMFHTGKDKVMVSFLQERTRRNLVPQILSGSILLHLQGTVILLMERLPVCVFVVLFIMILKLEKKTPQRKVSAVISYATLNQATKFR